MILSREEWNKGRFSIEKGELKVGTMRFDREDRVWLTFVGIPESRQVTADGSRIKVLENGIEIDISREDWDKCTVNSDWLIGDFIVAKGRVLQVEAIGTDRLFCKPEGIGIRFGDVQMRLNKAFGGKGYTP